MLVRKTVTVLFCDVDESVAIGERLDAESLRRLMARYFDAMVPVLEKHGATVEKFIGDAIVAVFGIPSAHEDDALRAVRAAVEMRRRIEDLNDELEGEFGVRLEVQIGVNTGEVVVGDPASGRTLATGDAMNVAARLQQAAGPGEILVGKATYPLVRHAIKAGPLEAFSLKGKSQPVAPWRLDDVDAAQEAVARRLDRPIVGRERELARLRDELAAVVAARECRLVTLLGQPGIGKSRLARALADEAAGTARTLTGRCLPYGEGITFWPIAQIVRELGGAAGLRRALAEAESGDAVAERVLAAVGRSEEAAGAEETFWAIRRLLEELAREQPLLVLFEDIHWAEPTFLDLIEYLAGWTRDAPILLLCLARPELLEKQPAWPREELLELEPLDERDADALLARLAAEAGVAQADLARVAAAAEGNPLFVEQMVALLAEDGPDGAPLPPSIHALLTARLDRLPAGERAVLERASVVGREFWRGAVADLSPVEERPDVGRRLMALARRDLVLPDRSSFLPEDDGFRFAHSLVRDAAYEGMAKELRAELHERFAAWLESRAGEVGLEVEEIVGYHLEQAYRYREQLGPLDERAKALARRAGGLLGRAGRRAFARDDMPAALKLLDRAVSLVTDRDPARLELVRELSSAHWAVGEVARAEALLEGLVAAASAAGDRRLEWYALLDRAIRGSVTSAAGADELERVAREALPVFSALGDDLGLARAHRRLSFVSRTRGRFADAVDESRRALGHARRVVDASEQARIVDSLCTSLVCGPAPAGAAAAECELLLEEARGNRVLEANVLAALAILRAMQERFDEARALARQSRQVYEELGLRVALAGLTEFTGGIELLAGNAAAAAAEFRRGLDILSAAGHRSGYWQALLAEALLDGGSVEEARELARGAAETSRPDELLAHVTWRSALAVATAGEGRGGEAVELARDAVAFAARTDAANRTADAYVALARALAATGEPAAAREAAAEAERLYAAKENRAGAVRASALLAQPVT